MDGDERKEIEAKATIEVAATIKRINGERLDTVEQAVLEESAAQTRKILEVFGK